ncbi:MAG: helix-turn-helix domain-containing protein [Paenibacillus sp.]|nr:helix-turn-helix domain-containing protein [Paenibacillus sp.]
MTRKEISKAAGIGMTTLYRLETGKITDISMSTMLRLMKAIGLGENWEQFLPSLPESPYLYNDNYKKIQRIRHSKK